MKTLGVMLMVLHIPLFSATHDQNETSETYTLISGTNLAKPGCEYRCGDLVVPYPFDIGLNSSCSIDPVFDVYCNTSLNPPKAFFSTAGYISIKVISDSTLRATNMVATRCYFPDDTTKFDTRVRLNFNKRPYSISQLNKFMLIGCMDYAWMTSKTKSMNVSTGCMVFCSEREDAAGEECSGSGCCQSSIPENINNYQTRLYALNSSDNAVKIRSFNPCSYAFVGEEKAFKYNGATDLKDTSLDEKIEASVPIVFDWAIGNLSCTEAKARDDFACQLNTKCLNSTRETGGYRCICDDGYQGNPYFPPGCQGTYTYMI